MSDAADRCLVFVAQSMATRKARWVSVGIVIVLQSSDYFTPVTTCSSEHTIQRWASCVKTRRPFDDSCELSRDASTVTWSTFTADDDAPAFQALQACLEITPEIKPTDMVPPGQNVSTLRMIQCRRSVAANEVCSQRLQTTWFTGDSILQ